MLELRRGDHWDRTVIGRWVFGSWALKPQWNSEEVKGEERALHRRVRVSKRQRRHIPPGSVKV